MRVEYQLTPDDLFAFQWRAAYVAANSRRIRRWSYFYIFLPLLLTALWTVQRGGPAAVWLGLSMLATVFPIVAALNWVIHRWLLRRAIRALLAQERPEKGRLGRHEIELDGQGIVERTAVGETRTSWSGVHRVEQDNRYIYLYTAPGAAHIIPKRAFAGTDSDAFFQFAADRMNQASATLSP
jgi:hypothetical protein